MAKLKGLDAIEGVTTGRDPGVSVPEGTYADAAGQEVGNAIARTGARGFALAEKMLEERQADEDSTFVSTAVTRYQTKSRDLLRKMQQENKDGAKDFTKNYTEALKQTLAQTEEEVTKELGPSKKAITAWRNRAQSVDAQSIEHSSVWEDTERKRFYYDQAERSIDEIGIGVQKGEITRDEALRRAGAVVADASGSLGPNDQRDMLSKAKRIVSTSHYLGMAERDPGGTMRLLKTRSAADFANDGLKPEDLRRIEHAAEAKARSNQHSAAIANSVTNDNLRTYNDYRSKGIEVPPELETSLRAALGVGKRGTDKVNRFDELKKHWDRVDESKTLPLDELRRKIDDMRAPDNKPGFGELRTAAELERRWKAGMVDADKEYQKLYNELKPMAVQGETLPKAKLERMYELGREMEFKPYEAEAARLVVVSENVADAKKNPLSAAAALRARMSGSREIFGETSNQENDDLAMRERHAVEQAFHQKLQERDRDPRAYVDRYYPEIADSLRSQDPAVRRAGVQSLLDAQRREGVLTGDLSIMSKAESKDAEARINEASGGRERVDVIRNIMTRYGSENWSRLQREFDRGKDLPPDIKLIVTLPWGTGRDEELTDTAMNLASAYDLKKGGYKDLDVTKTQQDSLDVASVRKMAPLTDTLRGEPGGLQRAKTYNDGVQTLAMFYKLKQGLSDSDAIKKASNELFFNHYEISDRVRVPRVVDGQATFSQGVRAKQDFYSTVDQVRKLPLDAAQYMPANLSKDPKIADMQMKDAREQFAQSIALKGYWATTPDGKGFRRFNDQGRPVVLADPTTGARRFMDYDFQAPPLSETEFWRRAAGAETPGPLGRAMRFWGIERRRDEPMQRWPQAPMQPGMEP